MGLGSERKGGGILKGKGILVLKGKGVRVLKTKGGWGSERKTRLGF